MIVVNIFGVPSSGKSTCAAYVFSQLKMRGINVELVTEFAKDKIWEDNHLALDNQEYLFGNQSYMISRCKNKVDVIVTDSPLPLSILYNVYNKDMRLGEDFNRTVMNVFNSYNNLNYLLLRTSPYVSIGRIHTEEESNNLKQPMINMLQERNIQYTEYDSSVDNYDKIVLDVVKRIR